jgi:NTE family protein
MPAKLNGCPPDAIERPVSPVSQTRFQYRESGGCPGHSACTPIASIFILAALLLCSGMSRAEGPAPGPAPAPAGVTGRPRIGLVLSGGGARGAAHIGVLKILERLHVPIDAIAGTSMGAVVGGLYASGMSAAEIEQTIASVDWQAAFHDRPPRTEIAFRRKEEDRQYLVNLPIGLRGKQLLIPKGLVQGQQLLETLRRLTLPVAELTDFDQLPTPFRAVATNLETGDGVVLRDGDLATALRASMSVPGIFAPVEYRNQVLVDGGLAENLPIDVARSMGVDLLIVSDADYPLQPLKNLDSLPRITNQMIGILMRKDSNRQLRTLGANDVLINLQLGDFSSYDFANTPKIVGAGVIAATGVQARLQALALSDPDYAQYLATRSARRTGLPRIEFVQVNTSSDYYRRAINDRFGQFVGKTVDPEALKRQVDDLYGLGYMETLDYHLVPNAAGAFGLDIDARRNSWGPDYLRFGLQLQDDFQGNTSFDASSRLLFTELNSLGAEFVTDLQVGTAPLLSSEFYQPLTTNGPYFVAPHLQVEAHDVAQVEEGKQVGYFRVRSFDYGLDFGREFSNWGEVRIGALGSEGSTRVELGDFSNPGYTFDLHEGFVSISYDQLDRANFPHSGQALTAQLTVSGSGQTGPGAGTDQFTFDWRGAHSWARNTLVAWVSSGNTIGGSQNSVSTYFPLGGFLNLSGVHAATLAGPQYAIARLIYLRNVGNGGEGILDVPAYVGLSLEDGNVWSSRQQISFGSTHQDAALFFGADTYIGPAYLAVGYDASGSTEFYLVLGHSF